MGTSCTSSMPKKANVNIRHYSETFSSLPVATFLLTLITTLDLFLVILFLSLSLALLLPVSFNGRSIPSGLWWRREDKWWWRRRKENINYDQRMNESRISLRIAFGHFKEREWLRHHSQSFFLAPLDWYTVQPRHDAPAFNEIQSIKYANHNSRKYFQSYLHVRNDKNLSKEHNFN